jgi:hypothetical protein
MVELVMFKLAFSFKKLKRRAKDKKSLEIPIPTPHDLRKLLALDTSQAFWCIAKSTNNMCGFHMWPIFSSIHSCRTVKLGSKLSYLFYNT